jgi:hypothetical protein
MEAIIATSKDEFIDAMDYKTGPTGKYFTSRKSATYYPMGGNQYSPKGVRMIKFNITGQDWLMPDTLRLMYTLNNPSNSDDLRLVNDNPLNMFRRFRLIIGGIVCEDIDYYNLVSNKVNILRPTDKRNNSNIETFPLRIGDGSSFASDVAFNSRNHSPVIPNNTSISVLSPLLSGLLASKKLLPLKYLGGIQIELELVNDYVDVALTKAPVYGPMQTPFWDISEVQILADTVSFNTTTEDKFYNDLRSGNHLNIAFSSFVHSVNSVGKTENPTVTLSRAFHTLRNIFVTFYKKHFLFDNTNNKFTNLEATHFPLRESNFFYHPQFITPCHSVGDTGGLNTDKLDQDIQTSGLISFQGYYEYNSRTNVTAQCQIGNVQYPEQPITTSQQAYYHLRKAINVGDSNYSMDILDREYRSHKFIMAFCFQKAPDLSFTGINTNSGDTVVLKFKNVAHKDPNGALMVVDGDASVSYADFIHTTMEYDAVLTITANGVVLLD